VPQNPNHRKIIACQRPARWSSWHRPSNSPRAFNHSIASHPFLSFSRLEPSDIDWRDRSENRSRWHGRPFREKPQRFGRCFRKRTKIGRRNAPIVGTTMMEMIIFTNGVALPINGTIPAGNIWRDASHSCLLRSYRKSNMETLPENWSIIRADRNGHLPLREWPFPYLVGATRPKSEWVALSFP
jgi:hypothetical protein